MSPLIGILLGLPVLVLLVTFWHYVATRRNPDLMDSSKFHKAVDATLKNNGIMREKQLRGLLIFLAVVCAIVWLVVLLSLLVGDHSPFADVRRPGG